ncbi:MAG TPA: Fe2+-dependent dioxygenase [Hyphomicrobiaceae bacterium]|nr:Fe2+-dependent dioxygenase [Hyphomicrobiaceae bacterium]
MILAVADVLSAAEVAELAGGLAGATFVDGKTTAGWSARLVKNNLQAARGPELDRLRAFVEARLREHAVFALATRPKALLGPLFSRYEPGHAYGTHADDALMGGMRTDVSFTLFLSPPGSYDGGELVIDGSAGEDSFKLEPGSVITYPSTLLHRVTPVTRGTRLAAVGWVRSYIRDSAHRELLFELETARRTLFEREGKTAEGDVLAKCAANLARMWCDD